MIGVCDVVRGPTLAARRGRPAAGVAGRGGRKAAMKTRIINEIVAIVSHCTEIRVSRGISFTTQPRACTQAQPHTAAYARACAAPFAASFATGRIAKTAISFRFISHFFSHTPYTLTQNDNHSHGDFLRRGRCALRLAVAARAAARRRRPAPPVPHCRCVQSVCARVRACACACVCVCL